MRHTLALLLLFLPVLAFAQTLPVITTVSATSDGRLTLGGLNFGAHADHAPTQPFLNAAFNDFSVGLNGGNLALDGTNNAAWSHQRTGGRTPTKFWARKDWIATAPDSIRRLGAIALNMSGTTGEYYSTFWLRCGPGVVQAAKFWRLYGDGKDIFLSITDGGTTGPMALMSYSNAPGSPSPSTVWGTVRDPIKCATTWQRFEVELRDTPGNDYLLVSIDGLPAFQRGSQLPSLHRDIEGSASNERQQWVTTPWGGNGHTLDFGHLVDGDFWGINDAFVNYTRARVELSDSPEWATARKKEIQIPLAWTGTAATVQLNPGAFQPGQTVYVYLVTASGAVNAAGMPFVLGSTGPPIPPIPTPTKCGPFSGFTPPTSGEWRTGVSTGTGANLADRMAAALAAGWAITGHTTSTAFGVACKP